ncbi:hypothetical protein FNF29_02291 [Cafeteria roenbergensis]|uniref:Protein kinase domain-containing protein n=1 Tax=Cafeteria roenbergensis TaxID=33653 RepID=A0A5A8CNV7_CAFRO|nr:hypothetical protein FNF29_02291 [Cafeteria roenbergensis]|eukprot:KAA0154762.1 hypothetical protein FNF29_02291 [Cafeteria roenbergensis]
MLASQNDLQELVDHHVAYGKAVAYVNVVRQAAAAEEQAGAGAGAGAAEEDGAPGRAAGSTSPLHGLIRPIGMRPHAAGASGRARPDGEASSFGGDAGWRQRTAGAGHHAGAASSNAVSGSSLQLDGDDPEDHSWADGGADGWDALQGAMGESAEGFSGNAFDASGAADSLAPPSAAAPAAVSRAANGPRRGDPPAHSPEAAPGAADSGAADSGRTVEAFLAASPMGGPPRGAGSFSPRRGGAGDATGAASGAFLPMQLARSASDGAVAATPARARNAVGAAGAVARSRAAAAAESPHLTPDRRAGAIGPLSPAVPVGGRHAVRRGVLATATGAMPPSAAAPRLSGASAAASAADRTRAATASAAPDADRIRWRKGERLGAGAVGTVFQGLNVDTGELMAIKQIDSADLSARELAALEQEVSLLRSFRHPNIVRYLGAQREGDTLCVFLEYVPGGSVKRVLERFGGFEEGLVRRYTRHLLVGLEYLHRNGIAHRDIKGGNVLVALDGVIKLADFGASKRISAPPLAGASRTGTGVKGTPQWMAPEVVREQEAETGWRRADIWSVGCTVIEMATGRPPWSEFANPVTAMYHIAVTDKPPAFPDSLSAVGHDFLSACLQLDPRRRPDVSALLLHPFVANAPTHAVGRPAAAPRSGLPGAAGSLLGSGPLPVRPSTGHAAGRPSSRHMLLVDHPAGLAGPHGSVFDVRHARPDSELSGAGSRVGTAGTAGTHDHHGLPGAVGAQEGVSSPGHSWRPGTPERRATPLSAAAAASVLANPASGTPPASAGPPSQGRPPTAGLSGMSVLNGFMDLDATAQTPRKPLAGAGAGATQGQAPGAGTWREGPLPAAADPAEASARDAAFAAAHNRLRRAASPLDADRGLGPLVDSPYDASFGAFGGTGTAASVATAMSAATRGLGATAASVRSVASQPVSPQVEPGSPPPTELLAGDEDEDEEAAAMDAASVAGRGSRSRRMSSLIAGGEDDGDSSDYGDDEDWVSDGSLPEDGRADGEDEDEDEDEDDQGYGSGERGGLDG